MLKNVSAMQYKIAYIFTKGIIGIYLLVACIVIVLSCRELLSDEPKICRWVILKSNEPIKDGVSAQVNLEKVDINQGICTASITLTGYMPTNEEFRVVVDAITNKQDVFYTLEYRNDTRHVLGVSKSQGRIICTQSPSLRIFDSSLLIPVKTEPVRVELDVIGNSFKYPFDYYNVSTHINVAVSFTNGAAQIPIRLNSVMYMIDDRLLGAGWDIKILRYREVNGVGGGKGAAISRSPYVLGLTLLVIISAGILCLIAIGMVLSPVSSRNDGAWNSVATVSSCVFALYALRSFAVPSEITSFTIFDTGMVILAFLQILAIYWRLFISKNTNIQVQVKSDQQDINPSNNIYRRKRNKERDKKMIPLRSTGVYK